MASNTSTLGWSTEKRRAEINRIFRHLKEQCGLSHDEAVKLLISRTGSGKNTVEGWISEGTSRSPPDWAKLDVLRYELALMNVVPLLEWRRRSR
jgi:hypothetical protein